MVAVETFAFSAAPESLQEILKVAGKWTHEEESLELRYVMNPAFGRAPMMATIWEEDLSIPALTAPMVVEVPSATPEAPPASEEGANEISDEEESFLSCQMNAIPGARPFGWGALAVIFAVRRRR